MIRVDRPLAVEGDPDGVPIPVTVSGGSGGGTSSDFGDPFPAAGTAAGFLDASGNMAGVELEADGSLPVTIVGGSGTVDQGTGGLSPWLVTGPLTDTQLRATAVPVSGPLTDTQLRATAVPVSGTVTASGPLTDTQLRATPVPVSGTIAATQSTSPWIVAGGGTAGTAAAGVVSVQGIASMTPVQVSQATATNLKAQAEAYQGGSAVGSGNPLQVSLANTGANATAVATSLATLPALTAGAALIGKVGIDQTTPGTTNGVQVNAALPAGTNAIGKLAANSGVDIGDVDVTSIVMPTGASATQVQGTVAHDGVDAQNPLLNGAHAVSYGSTPSAVAAADRTYALADRAGVPWAISGHPDVVTLEAAYTSAQTNTAIVTVSSGTLIVVTQLQVTVDQANTVGVGFRVGFGASTTPTTTGVVASHPGLVPGSGLSRGDGAGILGAGADGEDLRITSDVATGGSLRVVVSYFTIAG